MEERNSEGGTPRRRPSRRVGRVTDEGSGAVEALTSDLQGVTAAYGNTLLFIGYEVDGLVEIVVFPRYRFSSDDRVQGHLGNLRLPFDTPWSLILPQVDSISEAAQRYYQRAVTTRSAETRAHGARYEAAYSAISDLFRESWHGFSLRLKREGSIEREGARFEGSPPEPVLVKFGRETYTLHVAPTGSILLATGDRRSSLAD